jgi:hypothetical protein
MERRGQERHGDAGLPFATLATRPGTGPPFVGQATNLGLARTVDGRTLVVRPAALPAIGLGKSTQPAHACITHPSV